MCVCVCVCVRVCVCAHHIRVLFVDVHTLRLYTSLYTGIIAASKTFTL